METPVRGWIKLFFPLGGRGFANRYGSDQGLLIDVSANPHDENSSTREVAYRITIKARDGGPRNE